MSFFSKIGEAAEGAALQAGGSFFSRLGSGITEQFFGTSDRDMTYGGDPELSKNTEEKKKGFLGDINLGTVLIAGVIGMVLLVIIFRR
jgi:hypothetical protein